MRLLLDENLSPRLVGLLAEGYPGSLHVSAVGLARAPDVDLWGYARAHGLILVTKDADFAELSLLRGSPPLVLWVRRGNCSTATLAALLLRHRAAVKAWTRGPGASVLEIR